MEYNLNRQEAADILWVSTRTLDRWIRKWKFTHSKDGNKVMLSEDEVRSIWKKTKQVSNVVLEWKTKSSSKQQSITKKIDSDDITKKLWKEINENMWKFLEVLWEKDKKLEEKNQIILTLQHKVVDMEWKLKNSMALPHYEQEKKEMILEKENLKYENRILDEKIKKEKIRNIALMWVVVVFIIILILVASA